MVLSLKPYRENVRSLNLFLFLMTHCHLPLLQAKHSLFESLALFPSPTAASVYLTLKLLFLISNPVLHVSLQDRGTMSCYLSARGFWERTEVLESGTHSRTHHSPVTQPALHRYLWNTEVSTLSFFPHFNPFRLLTYPPYFQKK